MAPEPPSFEQFFDEEKERLLRLLGVITGSNEEAEDIAQEAFTRIFERWDAVRAMEEPAGYLHRTAVNLFRSRARRVAVALRRAVALGPERDVFANIDDRDHLRRTLAKLTPRQRAALVLTAGLGYSGDDAGKVLGVRASTIWALTYQARNALAASGEDRAHE